MITVNLEFTDKKTKVKIPESWGEVPVQQYMEYMEIDKNNAAEVYSFFLGVTTEQVKEMSAATIIDLEFALKFRHSFAAFANPTYPEVLNKFSIGLQPWAKLEEAKQRIGVEPKNAFRIGVEVADVYLSNGFYMAGKDKIDIPEKYRDIKQLNIVEGFGIVSFFLSNWRTLGNAMLVSNLN